MEAESRRIAVGKNESAPVREAIEAETKFGADVDESYGVGGGTHASLRVAVEGRVGVGHVRGVVVGVEVDAVPAAGESHMACETFPVESRGDPLDFAAAGLHEDGRLMEVGAIEGSTFSVARYDAEALGRRDGVAHAGAVAGGVGVVGAGEVGVVGGHSLEGEEVEFAVWSDAVGCWGPVAAVVCCFVASCSGAGCSRRVGCH